PLPPDTAPPYRKRVRPGYRPGCPTCRTACGGFLEGAGGRSGPGGGPPILPWALLYGSWPHLIALRPVIEPARGRERLHSVSWAFPLRNRARRPATMTLTKE